MDEVPMLYCILTLSYIVFGLRHPKFPHFWQKLLGFGLTIYAAFLTYLVTASDGTLQFVLFHLSFNSALWYALYQSYVLYRSRKGASSTHPMTRHQSRVEPLLQTFERGITCYCLAVTCWLTDMLLCEFVNPEYPSSVLPFNPQLHAWWHTFISIGLYNFVVFLLGERAHVLAKERGNGLVKVRVVYWMGIVPRIVMEKSGKRNGAGEETRLLGTNNGL